jgi:hypothetical protein
MARTLGCSAKFLAALKDRLSKKSAVVSANLSAAALDASRRRRTLGEMKPTKREDSYSESNPEQYRTPGSEVGPEQTQPLS